MLGAAPFFDSQIPPIRESKGINSSSIRTRIQVRKRIVAARNFAYTAIPKTVILNSIWNVELTFQARFSKARQFQVDSPFLAHKAGNEIQIGSSICPIQNVVSFGYVGT